jgi:hypothetical protein
MPFRAEGKFTDSPQVQNRQDAQIQHPTHANMLTFPKEMRVTSADRTVLVAESAGNPGKPAIVCCHGFANTALVFEPVFQDESLLCEFNLVSTTHRTGKRPIMTLQIRYDLRGYGRSDKPTALDAFTPQRIAEDFLAVCEAFGVKSAIYAGWSHGSTLSCCLTSSVQVICCRCHSLRCLCQCPQGPHPRCHQPSWRRARRRLHYWSLEP